MRVYYSVNAWCLLLSIPSSSLLRNIKWFTGVSRESKGEGGAVKMLDILFPLFGLSLQEANLVPDPAPTLDIFAQQVLYKFTV